MWSYRVYNNSNVNAEEINIVPSSNEQIREGLFNKVIITGDSDLKPENIKKDVEIFGIAGSIEEQNLPKINNANSLFIRGARLNYMEEFIGLLDNITDTMYMFSNCTNLTSLDVSKIDTSNVTTMNGMFTYCTNLTSLDVSNFNTSNVTNMMTMFLYCSKLTSLDLSNFNTSKVTDMSSMFENCSKLTSLNLSSFDTSKVTTLNSMFNGCTNLVNLDISNFNAEKVKNIGSIFSNCSALVELRIPRNIGKAFTQTSNNYYAYKFDLSKSVNLSYESLMDVLNNLYDLNLSYNVANGGTLRTQQLILGSTNMSKLTSEEIAIATNKGWTVS